MSTQFLDVPSLFLIGEDLPEAVERKRDDPISGAVSLFGKRVDPASVGQRAIHRSDGVDVGGVEERAGGMLGLH